MTSLLTRVTTATGLMAAGLLLTATAAYADTTTAQLKESQKGATAADFQSAEECSGYTGTDTTWHFLVPALDASPDSTGPDITDIDATFDAGTVVSETVVQNGKGINVVTSGASSVTDATATLSAAVPDEDAVLVLSHACGPAGTTTGGGGGDTTTTTGGGGGDTTTTTGGGGGGEVSTTGGGGGGEVTQGGSSGATFGSGTVVTGPAGGGGQLLPLTGSPLQNLIATGLASVVAGAALLVLARRRRLS